MAAAGQPPPPDVSVYAQRADGERDVIIPRNRDREARLDHLRLQGEDRARQMAVWTDMKHHIHEGNRARCCAAGTGALFDQYLEHLQAQLRHNDDAYQALFTRGGVQVHWNVDQATGRMTIDVTNPPDAARITRIVICQRPAEAAQLQAAQLQAPPHDQRQTFIQGADVTNEVFHQMITHIRHVVYGPAAAHAPAVDGDGGAQPLPLPPSRRPAPSDPGPAGPANDPASRPPGLNTFEAYQAFAQGALEAITAAVKRARAAASEAARFLAPRAPNLAAEAAGTAEKARDLAHESFHVLRRLGDGQVDEAIRRCVTIQRAQQTVDLWARLAERSRDLARLNAQTARIAAARYR